MRISITFAILLLSLSIMSYGLTGAVSAQSNVPPISVATDFPAYGETGLIGISGTVKDIKYISGKFFSANFEKSSKEMFRNSD